MNAPVTPLRTEAERALVERFAGRPADRLAEARRAAMASIDANGLPSRRVESWKYTDLRSLMKQAPAPAAVPGPAELAAAEALRQPFGAFTAPVVAFVNGHPQSLAALPAGVEAISLAAALAEDHPLLDRIGDGLGGKQDAASDLNLAFLSDGLLLHVPPGTHVETPLHLAFTDVGGAPFATFPRVFVLVGEGASLTLVESHRGSAGTAYQSNVVVELVLEADARVEHVRANLAGDQALSLATLALSLGDRARFESVSLTLGAQVSRYQIFASGPGEDINLALRGGTMIRGRQHADVTLHATHAAPGGESRELFKTVVDDEATGVFQGKIVVDSIAQKTDGRMHSAALLLAENAAMNNKPELEIFADDVQCAHGATVGALDDDLLFYALARGIPRREAEALLLQSFVGEALEFVSSETLREALVTHVAGWLAERAS